MKFSIVTPSFNQARFISQTINSVINQTGDFDIEYYVYDGGSTDGTVDILEDTEIKLINNPRIKFYWQSKKDKGQSDAINQALSKATGDIFAYINSDDYYEPNVFQRIAQNIKDNSWITGYSHIVNVKNELIQKPITLYKNFWLDRYSTKTLLILNYISQPSTFFKRELFTKFGPFDENLHLTMDYNFWLNISRKYQPKILKQYISNFRIHSNSKGKIRFIKQFSEDYATAKKYTNNTLILFLHRLHNQLILFIYKLIK